CRGRALRRARSFPPRASPEKTARSPPCADNRHKKIRRVAESRQTHSLFRIDATGIRQAGGELRPERTRRRDRNSSPETRPPRISLRGFSPPADFITE